MEGLEEGLHRLGKRATAHDLLGVCGLHESVGRRYALQSDKQYLRQILQHDRRAN